MKTKCLTALLVTCLHISIANAESKPTANAESKPIANEIKPIDFYRQASASPPKDVTAQQLADWLANQAVVLIDLRAKEAFEHAHIRGAINIPIEDLTLEHLKTRVANRNTRIVVYCANNFRMTRMIALTTLGYPAIEQLGYRNVFRLEDLWRSKTCSAAEKHRAKNMQTDSSSNSGCESLLPMDRAEK